MEADAIVEALLLIKEATHVVMQQTHSLDSATAWAWSGQLDDCLRRMVGQFTALYVTEASRRLHEVQARTALMLSVVRTASATLDLDQVLSRLAEDITAAIDVPYCGFFLVDETWGTVWPKFQVTVQPIRSQADQEGVFSMPAAPIATYSTFLGQVVAQKQPLTCYDVQTDPRFDGSVPRRLGFRSVLGVPFVVQGRVVAVAYVLTMDENRTFTGEEIELVWNIANTVGLAIENARLHQQVRQLAALEERNRLAREMHDNLSQALGVLKLKLSLTGDLLDGGEPAGPDGDLLTQVRDNLLEMKAIAAEAYTDTREAIFDLRMVVPAGTGFVAALQAYLAKYRASYGIDATLIADAEATAILTMQTTTQLIQIIQEALTNVRKHARTAKAWIHLERDGDDLRTTIADNGQGFDPARMMANAQRSYGLQVMQERAASMGGRLAVESRPGQGTHIIVWTPLCHETGGISHNGTATRAAGRRPHLVSAGNRSLVGHPARV